MLLGNNGILAVNVSLYSKLPFDPFMRFLGGNGKPLFVAAGID